ncbi:hypothetical protein [Robbsia sp. KACC 23696]|uniref:hypothetical protein n=1 Tax=Robbsia sp. KACC 23696 TaxID=3149231 RepID=UPI00325A5EB6
MNAPAQTRTLQDVAQPPARGSSASDLTINMFSAAGFELAQRLARAYMTSNAVPMPFRSVITKRQKVGDNYEDVEVENPAAMGNCLVAIETAMAVRMSITAVMQNAHVIEGRLTWSAQYKIAAINASGRFSPLRFRMTHKGRIKAKYKEKGQWNKQNRKYDMIEKEIDINDIECVAWAYVMERGRATSEIVEGPPVSMLMAVEEGWYSKPGSKWQTSMKDLMLTYRAGSFFGNIHAPDVVMGMGRTSEELHDTIDAETLPDGSLAVDIDRLREPVAAGARARSTRRPADATDVEHQAAPADETQAPQSQTDTPSGEAQAQAGGIPAQAPTSAGPAITADSSYDEIANALEKAKSVAELDVIAPFIGAFGPDDQDALYGIANDRKFDIETATKQQERPQRARGNRPAVE